LKTRVEILGPADKIRQAFKLSFVDVTFVTPKMHHRNFPFSKSDPSDFVDFFPDPELPSTQESPAEDQLINTFPDTKNSDFNLKQLAQEFNQNFSRSKLYRNFTSVNHKILTKPEYVFLGVDDDYGITWVDAPDFVPVVKQTYERLRNSVYYGQLFNFCRIMNNNFYFSILPKTFRGIAKDNSKI